MTTRRIYMIRHGKAAAGWGQDADPPLDATGRDQAIAMVEALQNLVSGPLPILTSPLRRCQETAMPLAQAWQTHPRIEPRLRELPSPMSDLSLRVEWLRRVMRGGWPSLERDPESVGTDFLAWREGILSLLTQGFKTDIVMVSHFIAINVAHGAAAGHNRVVGFQPDNCSITIFESDGTRLSCIAKGVEAETKVN
jgi:broad specificity phosphatase PhoE